MDGGRAQKSYVQKIVLITYEIHHVARIILNSAPVKAIKLQGITIKSIRSKKATFLRKALSSKNPKELWEMVNRILDLLKNRIKHDPGDLTRYYTELASTLTNKENIAFDQSLLANILPELEKDTPLLCNILLGT